MKHDTDTSFSCVAFAASIIGDKWTPMILAELRDASSVRFCQLQNKAGGINPRTLSARLVSLEMQGIIEKKIYSGTPVRIEYVLTTKGRELLPVIDAMSAWGQKHAPGNGSHGLQK